MWNLWRYLKSIERAFFCALLIVGLSACDRPDPTIIRFGLATAPVTLDPRFITDATSYRIARLVYQSLVDFDSTHQAVPALATWEALSPTHYRFELRVGASFHNGDAVEAADVVATYRSILDPEVASPHRGALTNVTGINEIDPNTVYFTLENPDPLKSLSERLR